MSWPGTTDQQRSLFLKGFKLSDQGKFEDPTYLGFKIVVDFGTLPVDPEFGQPPSPLFKTDNYEFNIGGMASVFNPFGQGAYTFKGGPVQFYSAQGYLRSREGADDTSPNDWPRENVGKRSRILAQFKQTFRDLLENHPWFLQSIEGLDKLYTISRGGYTDESDVTFNPSRTAGKTLTINCLESFNQRMSALGEMYKQATFDPDYMRELVPRNLKRFKMYIFVNEIRNFFKTSRLLASSTTLTAVNNVANLLGGASNSGRDSVSSIAEQFASPPQPDPGSSSSFGASVGSFARNVSDNSGLQDEIDYFRGQADQSDIKPLLIFECSNCEFDFDDSTSIPSELSAGSDTATPISYSFKIHVGRVRTKYQFPNIRTDKKPLVLADGWDQNRTSVSSAGVPDELTGSPFAQNLLNQGEQLLTNFVSNSINDFINEGIAQFVDPLLNGLDQSVLGNIYSFNPSEILGQASFNNAQQFFDQVTSNGINAQNLLTGELPNPQTMGLGGPKERAEQGKYRPPSEGGPKDAYANVPGPNLGVASPESGIDGRIYPPPPGNDFYPQVPGEDLGVPNRLYNGLPKNDDTYPGVPGVDLGVPDRVYPEPTGDFYENVPGEDLGVPGRTYPEPSGDLYENTPGSDLGVPDRLYPAPEGDFYEGVPGPDLGGSARIYSGPDDDVYAGVPGEDLGGPVRVYNAPEGDAYSGVPGPDLGGPERIYNAPEGDVYAQVPGSDLGGSERLYTKPEGDVYDQVPGSDLGGSQRLYDKPEGDVYSGVPGPDLGVSDRVYVKPEGDVYDQVPGPDLGGSERLYAKPDGDVYGQVPGSDLGGSQRLYDKPGGDVYQEVPGQDLGGSGRIYNKPEGDVYKGVPGQDLGVSDRIYQKPEGDVYKGVPGPDLGGQDRNYSEPVGDVYGTVPGQDLGGRDRVYPAPGGDVYPNSPGSELGVPQRIYKEAEGDVYPTNPPNKSEVPASNLGDVYMDVPGKDLASPQRVYPEFKVDAYETVPGRDLGGKPRVYLSPEGDAYRDVPGKDLGVSERAYPPPDGDVYEDVPGKDLGGRQREYPSPDGDTYPGVPGPDLGGKSRNYLKPEGDVYIEGPGTPISSSNIDTVYEIPTPQEGGNSAESAFDTSPTVYPPFSGEGNGNLELSSSSVYPGNSGLDQESQNTFGTVYGDGTETPQEGPEQAISQPRDVYSEVPGSDLGRPERNYPRPSGNVYAGAEGQQDQGENKEVYLKSNKDLYPNSQEPVRTLPDYIDTGKLFDTYDVAQFVGNLENPVVPLENNLQVYPSTNSGTYESTVNSELGGSKRAYTSPGGDVYEGVPGPDLGGTERAYPSPNGDVYDRVPGPDLGGIERAYPTPVGDSYEGVPGPDLGGIERAYPAPDGDAYKEVPGQDLGGSQRAYSTPSGDVYENVPGQDLGGSQRAYPSPDGDVYKEVPGQDLGGSQRAYTSPAGDIYKEVPGQDLGGSQRAYPAPSGDVYDKVPGQDLGGSQRAYPAPSGDVYENVPGQDLGGSQRAYPAPDGDVYKEVPGQDLGGSQRAYPAPDGDVYKEVPGRDLGGSQRAYSAPSGDVYENVPGQDLGGSQRAYPAPDGDVYKEVPGQDLGGSQRAYPAPSGDVYDKVPGQDLGGSQRAYPAPDGDVYKEVPGQDLGGSQRSYPSPDGDVYKEVPGQDLGGGERVYSSPKGDAYPESPAPRPTSPTRIDDMYSESQMESSRDSRESLYSSSKVYPQDNSLGPQNLDSSVPRVYPENMGTNSQLGDISPKVYKEDTPSGQLKNSETLYPVNNNLPGQAVPNPLDAVPSVYRNEGPRTIRGDMDKVYPKTAEDFVMERNLEPEQGLGNLKPEERYNQSLGDFNPPDEDFIE